MAYVPVGMTTTSTGLAHLVATYYSKVGLDRAQKTFRFKEPAFSDMMPKRVGRTCQWFRYDNMTGTTATSREGTVGTSLTISSKIVAADLSQYSAFISLSTFVQDTAIDPIAENASDLLGYQAGLSNDLVMRAVVDNFNSSTVITANDTYLTAEDVRGGYTRLQGRDFLPFDDGNFLCILHPYTWFDVINDPAVNGYSDMFKYSGAPKFLNNDTNARKMGGDVFNGVKWLRTTNVATGTDAHSRNTYRVYLFAKNGVGYSSLEGVAPSDVTDPNTQKFKINTISSRGVTPYDPTGEIGTIVSYRYTFTGVVTEGPSGIGGNFRYVTWDVPTRLGL